MTRMTWHIGPFDLKSLKLSKSRSSNRSGLSLKWKSKKVKEVEPLSDNNDINLSSEKPVAEPQVITIPEESAVEGTTTLDINSTETEAEPVNTIAEEVLDEERLTEFTSFPNLPVELRCKIWKHASHIPRNVNIWSSDFGQKLSIPLNTSEDVEEGDVLVIWKLCSTTPSPAILHACAESRAEGLKHYRLEFGTSYRFRDFTFTTHPRIYFNFEVDRLCIMESFEGENSRACNNFFDRMFTNGTRYVGLNVKRFQEDPRRECTYIRPFLARCMDRGTGSSIRSVFLASPDYNREMRGVIDFKECGELTGDVGNVNTTIVNGLKGWIEEKESERKVLDTWSGCELELKTLVINGKDCVE